MRGDVEICRDAGAWRVGVEGEPLLQGAYRTLEEAIETAWGVAARLKVAIHVARDRAGAAAA
jgi:hypothetical protein